MNATKLVLCALAFATMFGGTTTISTQAQPRTPDGVCERAGLYVFEGVNRRASENLPSLTRKFSVLGLIAATDGCHVKITCYASNSSETALKNMKTACTGVSGQMLRTQLDRVQRRNDVALAAVRAWQDSWEVEAVKPPSASLAGKVYIELQ